MKSQYACLVIFAAIAEDVTQERQQVQSMSKTVSRPRYEGLSKFSNVGYADLFVCIIPLLAKSVFSKSY